MKTANELFQEARKAYKKAQELIASDSSELNTIEELMVEATELEKRAKLMRQAEGFEVENEEEVKSAAVQESYGILEKNWGKEFADNWMAALDAGETPSANFSTEKDENRSLGDFFVSVRKKDHKRLTGVYESKSVKDMDEGSGPSGGYTVPEQELMELLEVDIGTQEIGPRARTIPMRSSTLTMPMLDQGDTPAAYWKLDYYGGVLSYWTEEGGTKTETEPEFKQLEMRAHKLAGYTQASDELLADSGIGIANLLSDLFRRTIIMRREFSFLQGTGVGMPLGILNGGALLTQSRDTSSQINYADIANMVSQMLPSSFANAVWYCSLTALPQLLQMQDGAGNEMYIPNATGGVSQSMPGQIFGRPVVITEKLPTLGNEGDLLLADPSYYLIGERQDTTIQASEHYAFTNDLTTWRFVHRVDGQPWLDEPIYIDTSNQVSPFVALAA